MPRRLNLIQVNFAQGPRELNAFYLPYSAGVLWAYARERVGDSWDLGRIAWRRDPIDDVYRDLADCDAIGFSSYVWNRNYSYALARRIKAYNPGCKVIFGGPEPAIEDAGFFSDHPYVDAVVRKEGEVSFSRLLSEGLDPGIPGLMINDRGWAIDTGQGQRIDRLDDIPSPYTTGVFDAIIAENPGVMWNATLETNRGCPYQCTFCDWGSLTYNKVKQFDLVRVFDELEWIGRNRCDWMSITDANFGMFIERDEAIADRLVEVQRVHGYPRRVGVSWAKNQKVEVARLSRKLMSNGFNNGLTLSVQSMDDRVLDSIKRRNLEVHRLGEMFDICAREGMTVNTELILGLPEETIGSWRRNVWQLLELGQHSGIEFFQAQLLENAEMNLQQREEYGIRHITVHDYMSGADQDDDWPEGVRVVTETRDLSSDGMLACQMFSWFINTWHINGISQWYSRFLRRSAGVGYEEFYTGFESHLRGTDWWEAERLLVEGAYSSWMARGSISVPPISGVPIHGWNLIHLTYLRMQSQGTFQRFHDAVRGYVSMAYGDVAPLILDDLGRITDAYVVRHDTMHLYPMRPITGSNVLDFMIDGDPLVLDRAGDAMFEFPEDGSQSLSVFMQNVYYARRRNFSKARITRPRKNAGLGHVG